MISETGPWTLGTLIGFPLGVLLTIALFAIAALLATAARDPDAYDTGSLWFGAFAVALVGLVAAAFTVYGMWPFNSEYHQWRTVTGTVERVDSRLINTGDGMAERYVVTIAGTPFAIDDTRAALVERGDDLTLACKREWVYQSVSGWACNWKTEP